ncbi:diaminopropionate ammonia-lyase [Paracoccus suum]|uniref:Diaminopropionate ammonia-lyase n=1 Tax=Paracoccus suum TaxID=2259340 RepID=A0A344PLF8_9RHOB|nr:diaminopropionate ammonia-lyase [Paracoccus suum]AXC50213.1 diaminopropionate ammonia-lyase [Paracoccus suum]
MYLINTLPVFGQPLDPRDAETLGQTGADKVSRILALRENNAPTPLVALPGLARKLGLASVHLKDEGQRLGLGSFKALGGAYAVMRVVQDEASRRLGRAIEPEGLMAPDVRAVAASITFACATDGNHGRSVAQGAQLLGARSVIFVHAGVSQARIDAIARLGAEVIRVDGHYDDSIAEATRVASANGWTILSDTSWPGYEEIPGLVMQGYTAIAREALAELPAPPTHVFLQAGVGGFAAAIAGHLALVLGERRPHVTVVDPARAASLFASAQAGRVVQVPAGEPTVMAMLECYEPSLVAFRVLERLANGFMTLEEEDAIAVVRRLAEPEPGDPPVVAGESGGVGLAGAMAVLRDGELAPRIGLGPQARLLVINTEGATDPALFTRIVGRTPETVLTRENA